MSKNHPNIQDLLFRFIFLLKIFLCSSMLEPGPALFIICINSYGLNLTEANIIPTMSREGRLDEPREVAQGLLFLSSASASYVHGTVLHGGFELL
ncbi:hypothetical protein [Chryseobacterium sp. VAUSW3]|uniref:hypothetical protein n=1 Tax=Chryseobacterium sp. VAUSW3 TaxID=2010998 RepID=UPI0011804D20|nr:hypothetical protein [Chryseobacterium sp. VAUSW3]